MQHVPPAESPPNTISLAGTAAWKEPGGGARRLRYAVKQSSKAAGKGPWGESLYRTLKMRPLVYLASRPVRGRVVAGSSRYIAPPWK